ncbi:MAG: hypothetical protein WD598_05010 [Acidimicrobiia bacterium]
MTTLALIDSEINVASSMSSPFGVGPVPEGYDLISAGRGTEEQLWGSDEEGSEEPFTVLAPANQGRSTPDVVIVSVTGFEGYQGGLSQAAGFGADGLFELDGQDAIYTPADERSGDRWADLVVIRAENLALRVTSPGASRKELVEIARATVTDGGRSQAPTVVDPPRDLEVIGSVHADLLVALRSGLNQFEPIVPGPPSAHGVGWLRGEREQLMVLTLPGTAADLEALHFLSMFGEWRSAGVKDQSLAGNPGVVIRYPAEPDESTMFERRIIVARTTSGELLVVAAAGPTPPSMELLFTLAESLQVDDVDGWELLLTQASAPVTVEPDPGGVELERGRAGDVEWLLQARPADELGPIGSFVDPAVPNTDLTVDGCLKLSTGLRVCASSGSGGVPNGEYVSFWNGVGFGDSDFPAFALISTSVSGARVRIRTSTDTDEVPLRDVPGTTRRAAIVFVENPGLPGCIPPDDPRVPATLDVMLVEVLDATGAVVDCLGLKPG